MSTVKQLQARESVGRCPLPWFAREGIRVVTVVDL